jgi:hypothetical protein
MSYPALRCGTERRCRTVSWPMRCILVSFACCSSAECCGEHRDPSAFLSSHVFQALSFSSRANLARLCDPTGVLSTGLVLTVESRGARDHTTRQAFRGSLGATFRPAVD